MTESNTTWEPVDVAYLQIDDRVRCTVTRTGFLVQKPSRRPGSIGVIMGDDPTITWEREVKPAYVPQPGDRVRSKDSTDFEYIIGVGGVLCIKGRTHASTGRWFPDDEQRPRDPGSFTLVERADGQPV